MWNLRIFNGREDKILEAMKLHNIDYLTIIKIKRKCDGQTEMKDGYWVFGQA